MPQKRNPDVLELIRGRTARVMATVPQYNLRWATGADKMLIVSVGTGTSPNANKDLAPGQMNLLYNASSIPSALMFAAANEQDFLCRVFGDCRAADPLDREVGDLIGAVAPQPDGRAPWPTYPKLFTYMRYNAELTEKGLQALGLPPTIKPSDVQEMDSVAHIAELQEVGKAVAAKKVQAAHFAGFVYGPAFGTTITPFGLATVAGLAVGDTVAELRAVYPSAVINADDELSGPSFVLDDGLFGFLTGVADTDTIIAFQAGAGCGE